MFIRENKLDRSFPDAQSQIKNYHFTPFRKHKNNKGRSKLIFVRKEWKNCKKTNKFFHSGSTFIKRTPKILNVEAKKVLIKEGSVWN